MLNIENLISEGYSDSDILELFTKALDEAREKQEKEEARTKQIYDAKLVLVDAIFEFIDAIGVELSEQEINKLEKELLEGLDAIANSKISYSEKKTDNGCCKKVKFSTRDADNAFVNRILKDLMKI